MMTALQYSNPTYIQQLNILNINKSYSIESFAKHLLIALLLDPNPPKKITPRTPALHDGKAPYPTHSPAPGSALQRMASTAGM